MKSPFSGADCAPEGFKILEYVEVPEIWVLWFVFSLSDSREKGMHLTINELCWRDESSGCNDVKGTVQRHGGEGGNGNCTDNGGSV